MKIIGNVQPEGSTGTTPRTVQVTNQSNYLSIFEETIITTDREEGGQEYASTDHIQLAEPKNGDWIAQKRIVTPGKNYNNRLEILSGLSSGESVITFGFQTLTDGQPLIIQREE